VIAFFSLEASQSNGSRRYRLEFGCDPHLASWLMLLLHRLF
jgi:hypothetical protein